VKKRFPTLGHLTEVGILTENEQKIIEELDEKCIQHPKYWMSLVWAGAIVTRAKKEGRIKDDFALLTIIKEINKFRSGCGALLDYDWISIPLVYTQVVTLAVYTFFLSSLMGSQFLDPSKGLAGHDVDLVVPVFTFLQFFFYMGWLKVAEVLINPFGEDDDDFEMNWLIDRNLQVAYLIVDEMHAEHPELVKDQFWDEGIPDELPYTLAAEECRPAEPWLGSTADVEVTGEQGEFVFMDTVDEETEEICGSAGELNQIRIEDVKTTIPVNIKNGKLITHDSEHSIHESMATLPIGSMGARKGSMMSILQKMFQGSPSESSNMKRIGSVLSVSSKVSNPARRRRRRYARHNRAAVMTRNTSKASHLSSPVLSRIQTNENDIFKMSETSSFNSISSESSSSTSRRNSEIKAIEIRELLHNNIHKEKPFVHSPQNRHFLAKSQSKECSADNAEHTAMLRRKLEQVKNDHFQIKKELDSEISMDTDNMIPPQNTESDDAFLCGLIEQVNSPRLSSYESPIKHLTGTCFVNPVDSIMNSCQEPLKHICSTNSAKGSSFHINKSLNSLAGENFDLGLTEVKNEETSEEESEDQQSVIENLRKNQSEEYLDEDTYDPGNLGTIQEHEEYGYLSDSDTVNLIPNARRRKELTTDKKDILKNTDTSLPAVQEEDTL